MKNYESILELTKDSIRVYPGMIVVWPQFGKEETLNVMELVPKFNGHYAANNSTVSFITDNTFYVTPYTRVAMKVLRDSGFCKANFYVPFSNWDYPKFEKLRWESLREMAQNSYEEDFEADCFRYCDEHGIGAISEETLKRCFRMPKTGVHVKHPYFENWYYPIISSCLDSWGVDKIGRYCTNNGKVVFVYRDGATYVAKGYKILDELRSAGYKEDALFVPFSNGEVIQDPVLRTTWESLSK